MTRFVIDATVGLHIVAEGIEVDPRHELLAPTLFRSQTMTSMHEAVVRGDIPADVAFRQLETLWKLKIRLLGDAVLRRVAWDIAQQMGWPSTLDAEYIALTKLQGDAFVTLNDLLARQVRDLVPIATIDDLRRA
jgi:predicted nucleic acid-binding protein